MLGIVACEKRYTGREIVSAVLLHGAVFISTPKNRVLRRCAGHISGRQPRVLSFIDLHPHRHLSLHSLMALGMLLVSVFSMYDLSILAGQSHRPHHADAEGANSIN